jgi:hypothetical protein
VHICTYCLNKYQNTQKLEKKIFTCTSEHSIFAHKLLGKIKNVTLVKTQFLILQYNYLRVFFCLFNACHIKKISKKLYANIKCLDVHSQIYFECIEILKKIIIFHNMSMHPRAKTPPPRNEAL